MNEEIIYSFAIGLILGFAFGFLIGTSLPEWLGYICR